MKISFNRPEKQQGSVNQAQENIKNARPEKLPIARFLLIGAGVMVFLALVYTWWASGHLYARGIVTSQLDSYTASNLSRVGDVIVQPGDVVQSGDPLFELISDEAQNEFLQVQELIKQQSQLLIDIDPEHPIYSKLYDQGQLQSLHAARSNIDVLKVNYERAERKDDLGEADRNHLRNIGVLQKQVVNYKQLWQDKQQQLEHLQLLFKLDAATALDVKNAEQDTRTAHIDFDSAQTKLKQIEEGMVSTRQDRIQELSLLHKQLADAENHFKVLKARFDSIAKQEYERIQSEIRRLTLRADKLKDEAGPKMYYARNAGVIGELAANTGSIVKDEGLILNIATTDVVWIDAYIPTHKASILNEDEPPVITILSRIHNQRFEAYYNGGGLEVNVPAVIYNTDKTLSRAIHVRVDLKSGRGNLKPGNIVDVIFE